MIAAGIDLGGTKIEAQIFDFGWNRVDSKRIATPKDYQALVQAMADLVTWCDGFAAGLPVGVCAAGLINPASGLALTANLAASGKPFPADIARQAGRQIGFFNDCRAFALSEAVFGAARGAKSAIGLTIGTGMAGGAVIGGRLMPEFASVGGEYGHFALPAGPMIKHGLPVLGCGCGRMGCVETYVSGTGLARIARHVTGQDWTAEQAVAARNTDAGAAQAWTIWLELATEVLITLCFTLDPEVVVIGGGLSKAPGLVMELQASLAAATLRGFAIPAIRLAEGGDASGARGAAYAAWKEAEHE